MLPDPRRGHRALDNGTVLLPLPQRPTSEDLSFPFSSWPDQNSWKNPPDFHIPSKRRVFSASRVWVLRNPLRGHPPNPGSSSTSLPSPHTCASPSRTPLMESNQSHKQNPHSLWQGKGLTPRMRTRDSRRQFQTLNKQWGQVSEAALSFVKATP